MQRNSLMHELKAPSLQSLLESDRESTDSLLESLQIDIEDLDDVEYSIPPLDSLPTLESVLNELDYGDSDLDLISETPYTTGAATPTPTPSAADTVGSILRHVVLQGITAQLSSAADRINAGFATAVDVSCLLIGVGTSHGHILNFDTAQTLRWAYQDPTSQGAVTCLSYNEDNSRLLAGFARGLVIMIDTKSGDVLRSLLDVITPNTGVLNIKWTGRPALALCSDSGGSVWSLSFTRKLGIRGCASRCLFSGARGEVCAVEPLILEEDHLGLNSNCIIALATLSKFFVVMLRPRLKVIKFHILNGPAGCLPLLAWQMVLIQAADSSRTIDPVLAVARGNQLYFHQITSNNGRISLHYLRHVEISSNLLAVHWLGPKCLACLNTSEMLHLIDVRTSKELECIDLANAGLVYGSAQFKGLATGGNVSPALALAGTHACYSSVVSQGIQLYVLGARNLHVISVRTWSERVTYLVNTQRWVEACELAVDGYRSAGDRHRRRKQARERIVELFHEYLTKNRTPEFCLGPIMRCMIEINELDLLWQELWDRLNSPGMFLTLVTEHIENDEIKCVSPTVAQALVDFWVNLSSVKLEEIILKLNWACLDLHQVLTAARKKKLFRAQIYLNTQALGDYIVSLTDLLPLIQTEDRLLGNCLLVYISSCLAGRGYPTGEIPKDQIANVKHEVLRLLTSTHSNKGTDFEKPYPYLRALLTFDTRETLNVLSLAFQEKEFRGDLGLSQRERIINILLEIMTPENSTWSQIGCLLSFISLQISSKCLPEDPVLMEKVLNYLQTEEIDGETSREHGERENAWLELISAGSFDHVPTQEQIRRARASKCWSVVEYLLEKIEKYDEILECHIKNPLRHQDMLNYIDANAKNPTRKIYPQLKKNFDSLLRIDCDRITKIVVDNYNEYIEELISFIGQSDVRLLFEFLKNLQNSGFSLRAEYCETYLNLLCQQNPEKVIEFLNTSSGYRLENALEIVNRHQLLPASVLLYEKQGDYQLAFNVSLDMLREASQSAAEASSLQVCALCARASQFLSEMQREEFWFPLLKVVLSRPELSSVTKNILHLASQHVDLSKLVQLVLNSGTNSGSFGDIRHLLVGMLSNSRYETLLLETTARILGRDLHDKFASKRNESNRGIWVTFIKCVVCRQRLFNQMDVVVFGNCGHTLHQSCGDSLIVNDGLVSCPRCGIKIPKQEPRKLAQPKLKIVNVPDTVSESMTENDGMILQLKAPPRNDR